MAKYKFFSECTSVKNSEYHFSVGVYYRNKRIALANVYIDLYYGNNIIKVYHYDGEIPNFSEEELKNEIYEHCCSQIARSR